MQNPWRTRTHGSRRQKGKRFKATRPRGQPWKLQAQYKTERAITEKKQKTLGEYGKASWLILPKVIGERKTIELPMNVGFMVITRKSNSGIRINQFFIEPQYQKQGYGTSYIEKLFETSKESGIEKITLGASSKEAVGFFKKLGFTQSDRSLPDEMIKDLGIKKRITHMRVQHGVAQFEVIKEGKTKVYGFTVRLVRNPIMRKLALYTWNPNQHIWQYVTMNNDDRHGVDRINRIYTNMVTGQW